MINSPELVQKILNSPKCLEKWDLIYSLFGRDNGLVTGKTTSKWKDHRKALSISHTMNSIESYRKIFDDNVKLFCQELRKDNQDENEFDFHAKFSLTAFKSLSSIFFGQNLENDSICLDIIKAMRM